MIDRRQVDDSQGDDAHSEAVLPEDGLLEKEQHDLQVSNASRATPAQALAVRSKIEVHPDSELLFLLRAFAASLSAYFSKLSGFYQSQVSHNPN
jgi:hypothetical protein